MGAKRYKPEDIERGLTAIIALGSDLRASETLNIPRETLRDWRDKHADRYYELRTQHEAKIAKIIAGDAEELAQLAGHKERALLEALDDTAIQALKPAEIAATLRNVTTSKALQVDKISSPLRERPSHVQHGTTPDELVARMARALGVAIDSTAIEVQNTDLPTDLALPPASASSNAQG